MHVPAVSLISFFYDRRPEMFLSSLGMTDSDKLQDFWTTMLATSEQLRRHPCFLGPLRQTCGTSCHSRCTRMLGRSRKSCHAIALAFLVSSGVGGEALCNWLICSYIKDRRATPEEVDALWAPILRDLDELATTGIALGGTQWRFFLLFSKGDLETRSNAWGLPHYNSAQVCSECVANRTTMPFTDLTAGAAWRREENLCSTVESFLVRCREPRHPLLTSSFAWRGMVPLDAMHVLDCHGVANIIGGSVLHYLVHREPRLGANMASRLASINLRVAAWYTDNPSVTSRMAPLRLSNLQSMGWAVLTGPAVKAANTRNLAPFFCAIERGAVQRR